MQSNPAGSISQLTSLPLTTPLQQPQDLCKHQRPTGASSKTGRDITSVGCIGCCNAVCTPAAYSTLPETGHGPCCTHISVQLPHKAGEVVVLEVARQKVSAELWWLPNDETAGAKRSKQVEVAICMRTAARLLHYTTSRNAHCTARHQPSPASIRRPGYYRVCTTVVYKVIPARQTEQGYAGVSAAVLHEVLACNQPPAACLRLGQKRWRLVTSTAISCCRASRPRGGHELNWLKCLQTT